MLACAASRVVLWFAVIVIAALFSPAPAADDIAGLLAELANGEAELGQAEKSIDELLEEHKSDERAYQSYTADHERLVAQAETIQRNFEEDARRQLEQANRIIENWNNQCSVDRVGTLNEAAYNRCSNMRAAAVNDSERIRASVDQQTDDFQRTQLNPLNERIHRQEQAINQLAARSEKRIDEFNRLKVNAERIEARIEQIRSLLSTSCAEAPTDEMASHCASIGFDR